MCSSESTGVHPTVKTVIGNMEAHMKVQVHMLIHCTTTTVDEHSAQRLKGVKEDIHRDPVHTWPLDVTSNWIVS